MGERKGQTYVKKLQTIRCTHFKRERAWAGVGVGRTRGRRIDLTKEERDTFMLQTITKVTSLPIITVLLLPPRESCKMEKFN